MSRRKANECLLLNNSFCLLMECEEANNVGEAFAYLGGSALFSALGSGAGYILGSFLGTAMGNELISNFFGINPSTQENITEGIHGLTLDGIINFFNLIFGR